MNVRERVEDDIPACVRVLEEVHRADRYPAFWPDDPAAWLSPRELIAAWVAESDGSVVGHVALVTTISAAWSKATGLPPGRLAEITRLFVSPAGRGAGLGSALVDTACAEAATRGLHPVLQVVETDLDAIRLYERRGWLRVASEPWAADEDALLLHYAAPPSS